MNNNQTDETSSAVLQDKNSSVNVDQNSESLDTDNGTWWFLRWFRWNPVSRKVLKQSESSILKCVKAPYNARYVNIPSPDGNEDWKIWTVSLNESSTETPLVLVHGLASGVALWSLNLEELSESRPLHAIDLLGFGSSSRPKFSSNADEAEVQFVESIETWRKAMGLEKIILLGHSLGAFLATSYSIQFPDPVVHLILADPWGFKDKPKDLREFRQRRIPWLVRMIVKLYEPLNPLFAIRLAGPLGPRILRFGRTDLIKNFLPFIENAPMHVSNYIFQCNAQDPTGESAFHAMMSSFAWAKNAMHHRVHKLRESIPMTLIYGSKSWVDHFPAVEIQQIRNSSYVDAYVLEGGHHVYADKRSEFNEIVIKACRRARAHELKISESTYKVNHCDPEVPGITIETIAHSPVTR